ncbi:MAG: acetyl-CoA carboxylase biotin carboxyl carrier protein [Flavobacteriales bacterium]|nr:acetyl-CoA carboxylase biotin carboxyl carrier protein [Flavobacteriales bacterium]MCB9364499.1 acetyl-CoA carboxylase biotin carboxyl carrier protein [Flavobacteriales bacterium]
MKASEIQELIKFVSKSGVSEVEIEDKDFKITIKTPPYKRGKVEEVQVIQTQVPVAMPQQPMQQVQQPVAQAAPAPAAPTTPAEPANDEAKYVTIKSPMIGTFYRKPTPDKPNFVNVGDDVANDTCVCIIEAMKLFNEIEAEVSGKIVKALVDDGSPVEYDQPLFLVDPS